MSWAIEERFIFDELGKERFRRLLEAHAEMASIEVITWCYMSSHFHLLIRVPNAEESRAGLDGAEILRRLGLVMGEELLIGVPQMLERMKEQSPGHGCLEYRQKLPARRMFDVLNFSRRDAEAWLLRHACEVPLSQVAEAILLPKRPRDLRRLHLGL